MEAPQPPSAHTPPADPIADLQERLAPQLEAAEERLAQINQTAQRYIRENPGTALLGAAALGFLIGKWASRR